MFSAILNVIKAIAMLHSKVFRYFPMGFCGGCVTSGERRKVYISSAHSWGKGSVGNSYTEQHYIKDRAFYIHSPKIGHNPS